MRSPLLCRIDTTHLVDGDGLVGCPRAAADVEASTCLTCPHLRLALRDPEGRLLEIRCTPPPRPSRSAWDLLATP